MSLRIFRPLYEPSQAHRVMLAVWAMVKPHLLDGRRLELVVRPETRSAAQNAMFHAMCEDAERSGLEWAGKPRTAGEWKVLFVSGHAVATKEDTEFVPGLEGEFVNIRERTSSMSKARGSSLIEYTKAFLTQHGVKLRDEEVQAA